MSNNSKLQSLTESVERFMPFDKWGFKQSAQFFGKSETGIVIREKWGLPIAIYDSDYCRVKFLFDQENRHFPLQIYYGRLHAPDDKWLMKWNGEDCYCWHSDIFKALKFIDGNTPQEAIEKSHIHPDGLKNFRYVRGQNIDNQPERNAGIHAECWGYYGYRLFELFDLRRPELWEQYTQFLQEYYDSTFLGRDTNPPIYKIC